MQEALQPTALWWQRGIVYQIYPRSFMDSNGDGIGDLTGVVGRLDYLQGLGIDAIWLSPIYPSPMADFGYDIANYTDIDPIFGDLATFDRLLTEAHGRGLKVILDLVPNHTSDEHPWFKESRTSRDNPKRDWYIWRDRKPNGDPPNNWLASFSGNAWEFDSTTGQYYLHLFDRKQPDLNWRNPAVRQAMYGVMRFWFERGVDGFRIDVLPLLIKAENLPDNPPNPDWKPGDPHWMRQLSLYTSDQPGIHEIVQEMRQVADEYSERVLIGETYLPYSRLVLYYGQAQNGIHLPFNFELVILPQWQAASVRQLVDAYEASLPPHAWPNWVLGNHDKSRIASRVGLAQARIAQMLLLTLRGTPTCYYGDELGMQDGLIPSDQINDPQAVGSPNLGRDPERTPMQWDARPQAGFSTERPWLPLSADYATVNVTAEDEDPHSFLSLTRRLIELRRSLPPLTTGGYRALETANDQVFAYLREQGSQKVLTLLNFSHEPQLINLAGLPGTGKILCSTGLDRSDAVEFNALQLHSDEGLLIELS